MIRQGFLRKVHSKLDLRNACELARMEVEGAGRRKRVERVTRREDSMSPFVREDRTP